jgi:hypothetical protein
LDALLGAPLVAGLSAVEAHDVAMKAVKLAHAILALGAGDSALAQTILWSTAVVVLHHIYQDDALDLEEELTKLPSSLRAGVAALIADGQVHDTH